MSNHTFIIQQEQIGSRESIALKLLGTYPVIHHKNTDRVQQDYVYVGDVPFVEKIIGGRRPDYYPEWTRQAWHREIGPHIENGTRDKLFIKPADRYKSFTGKVEDVSKLAPDFFNFYYDVVMSDVVNFVNEWRYYIADGKILTSWWYQGDDMVCETDPHGPSELPFDIPEDFCGAIDMGMLDTGEFALVEVQHPYAIGWYGDHSDSDAYAEFLIKGWKYLQKT